MMLLRLLVCIRRSDSENMGAILAETSKSDRDESSSLIRQTDKQKHAQTHKHARDEYANLRRQDTFVAVFASAHCLLACLSVCLATELAGCDFIVEQSAIRLASRVYRRNLAIRVAAAAAGLQVERTRLACQLCARSLACLSSSVPVSSHRLAESPSRRRRRHIVQSASRASRPLGCAFECANRGSSVFVFGERIRRRPAARASRSLAKQPTASGRSQASICRLNHHHTKSN